MESLEILFEKPPIVENINDRKVRINHPNTLLVGPSGSGKSTILIDFLSTKEPHSFLYINLNDLRVLKEGLFEKLEIFYKKHNLSLLAIDNLFEKPNFNTKLNLIATSQDSTLIVDGLEKVKVDMLDFEEFIAFSKDLPIKTLFNLYAKYGRSPKTLSLPQSKIISFLQENLQLALKDELLIKIFTKFSSYQSTPTSYFQIYKELKNSCKISKDRLYKSVDFLESISFLHFVPKFDSPKSAKKIYLNNFALKSALVFKKDFLKRFENIIFCELIALNEDIFYTNRLDFYLPSQKRAIVAIPFLPPELIIRRFKSLLPHLKELGVEILTVLTVGNEGSGAKDGIRCEIIPFWEWALRQ